MSALYSKRLRERNFSLGKNLNIDVGNNKPSNLIYLYWRIWTKLHRVDGWSSCHRSSSCVCVYNWTGWFYNTRGSLEFQSLLPFLFTVVSPKTGWIYFICFLKVSKIDILWLSGHNFFANIPLKALLFLTNDEISEQWIPYREGFESMEKLSVNS